MPAIASSRFGWARKKLADVVRHLYQMLCTAHDLPVMKTADLRKYPTCLQPIVAELRRLAGRSYGGANAWGVSFGGSKRSLGAFKPSFGGYNRSFRGYTREIASASLLPAGVKNLSQHRKKKKTKEKKKKEQKKKKEKQKKKKKKKKKRTKKRKEKKKIEPKRKTTKKTKEKKEKKRKKRKRKKNKKEKKKGTNKNRYKQRERTRRNPERKKRDFNPARQEAGRCNFPSIAPERAVIAAERRLKRPQRALRAPRNLRPKRSPLRRTYPPAGGVRLQSVASMLGISLNQQFS